MPPLTQLYFQKDFLRGPHPSPPPHACNFYINFNPLSCIKLFCGRERCVWGGERRACPALLGAWGQRQAGWGPRGRGDPALSPCETMRRSATGSPRHMAAPGPAGLPGPRGPPTPCPCPLFPDHSLLRTSFPCPQVGTHMCQPTVGTCPRGLHELSLCLDPVGKLSFFEK